MIWGMPTRRTVEECVQVNVRSLRDRGELEAGDEAVMIADGRRVQRVGVEWTRCHFGGERPWLICPGCGRRAAVLFDLGDDEGFVCRLCGNLAYQTENATRTGRKILRAKRLRVRLGGSGSLIEGLPEKARACILTGLSEPAYDRLRARGEQADQAAFKAIEEGLHDTRAWVDATRAWMERVKRR